MPVRLVPVFVEECCGQGNGQAPYDAERPPYKAAAAHPHTACDPAEDGLSQVSEKGADEEQPEQFIESAAFCESSLFYDLFRCLFDGGIGLCHTPVHIFHDPAGGPVYCGDQLPVTFLLSGFCAVQMQERGQGDSRVDYKKSGKGPYDDGRHRFRDKLIEKQEKRIAVPDGSGAEYCPQQGVLNADISVEIPFLMRIIPPFMPVQAFQDLTCVPFGDGCLDAAADQQKDRVADQVGKSDLHNGCGDAIDRTERSGGKSPVGETPVFDRTDHSLDHPAEEGINEKEPEKFRDCKPHSYPVYASCNKILNENVKT